MAIQCCLWISTVLRGRGGFVPHLDVVSYMAQYVWANLALLILLLMVLRLLPIFQRQKAAREIGLGPRGYSKRKGDAPEGVNGNIVLRGLMVY